MSRAPERREAASLEEALAAMGATGPAIFVPDDLDAAGSGLSPGGDGALALLDAETVDVAAAIESVRQRLRGGALVVVRAKARGEGLLGALRGRRALEDRVEPLLALPLEACGVVEVRGLFGVTLVWARLSADSPDWM